MKHENIVINGLPGTGSTTVAKMLSEKLGFEHVYAGGIFREMARKAGQSLEVFMAAIIDRPDEERKVDDALIARLKKGSVIIESRVVAWLLPREIPAYKVWLTCEFTERVRRISQREPTPDVEDRVKAREQIDIDRYTRLYNLDLVDLSVFDRIIDTTSIPARKVASIIAADIKSLKQHGKLDRLAMHSQPAPKPSAKKRGVRKSAKKD